MQPIGIFGGTFDPIHIGHLRMAEELREHLALAQVRFVPSAHPPHRDHSHTRAEDRARMVELAITGNTDFTLDRRELARSGPSYTVDTLLELRRELGDAQPICLLMGSDAFLYLATWHRWRQIPDLAHIVVAYRPGAALDENRLPDELQRLMRARGSDTLHALQTSPAGKVLWQPITALDISSSKIRDLLRQGQSTRYLLPETVRTHIDSYHLYGQNPKDSHGT